MMSYFQHIHGSNLGRDKVLFAPFRVAFEER